MEYKARPLSVGSVAAGFWNKLGHPVRSLPCSGVLQRRSLGTKVGEGVCILWGAGVWEEPAAGPIWWLCLLCGVRRGSVEKVGEAGVVGVRVLLWGAGSDEFCFSPAAWLGAGRGVHSHGTSYPPCMVEALRDAVTCPRSPSWPEAEEVQPNTPHGAHSLPGC